jgi:hypothetical protein
MSLNLFGLAVASTANLFVSGTAWAVRAPRQVDNEPALLDPTDPQAHALSYSVRSHKKEQSCSNCALYTGTKGEEVGPCAIFSYRVAPNGKQLMVDADGWCRAWGSRQDL